MDSEEAGRRLATRHQAAGAAEADPVGSLLNYADRPLEGDWTLRSALVRLAQPEPERVADLLRVSRRLDGPLHHVARALERHATVCDRAIEAVEPDAVPNEPIGDVRVADLARLVAAGLDERAVVRGYDSVAPLDEPERQAVPLLAIAVDLEGLAVLLARWADTGPEDPPVGAVSEVTAAAAGRLDHLGVPEETGPPPGARSRG